MHKYSILLLLLLTIFSCSSDTKKNNASANKFPNDAHFIKGLTNSVERTTLEAEKGITYKPSFPKDKFIPYELTYSVEFGGVKFLKAFYEKDSIVAYLPLEFIVDYEHDEFVSKNNKVLIGEYDFNKDGTNEVLLGYRDIDHPEVGMIINIVQYFPPPFDKNVLCDYWISLGTVFGKGIGKDDFAYIENNKIIITNKNGEDIVFTVSNDLFKTEISD